MDHIVKPFKKIQFVAILRCILSLKDCFTSICYLPGTLLGTGCAPWNMIGFCPQEAVRIHEGTLRSVLTGHDREHDAITLGSCFSG